MIERIAAKFIDVNNHVFNVSEEYGAQYECTETYIVPVKIEFYGIDEELDENEVYRIYDGHYEKADKIGKLSGFLVLCSEMLQDGYSPVQVCDELDGDLMSAISTLSNEDAPLNEEDGNPYDNVFYINELKMELKYDSPELFSRIIKELPYLIKEFVHVTPQILSYYIAPISDEWRKHIEDNDLVVKKLALQKLFSEMAHPSDNSVLFAKYYEFSDTEVNAVLEEDNSSAYPQEYKDFEKFFLYKYCGFEEIEETCLVYKLTHL